MTRRTDRYAFNRPGRQEHVGRHAEWRVPEPPEVAACGCMCRVVRRDSGVCVRCWLFAKERGGPGV